MSTPATADEQTSDTPADTLTCKACGRTIATISREGDLVPQGGLDEGCNLCKDMVRHYNDYQEAQDFFKTLEHRRNDYGPRVAAVEAMHEAQMELGNFIQTAVAWDSPEDNDDNDDSAVETPNPNDQPEEEQVPEQADPSPSTPAHPRRRKRSLSPQSSPGPHNLAKRPRLLDRNRRVSFDPSVVFREAEAEARRVDAVFSRNSDNYSPGRYAAPEGAAWLDTSGHSMKETKFFGVTKRGQKWVPTKDGLEMDEEWESARGDEGSAADEEEGGGEVKDETEGGRTNEADDSEEHAEGDLEQGDAAAPEMETALPEPDTSDQESAPGLEPSSRPAARENVDIDENYSSADDASPEERQLPVPQADGASRKPEPITDEEVLAVGLAWTSQV